MNKRLLISCFGMMMSAMSFAQWVAPSVADFFTPDTYAKEFKVSEAGADTTVYYLYNIEAGGFLSNNTCSNHAPWSTHAALKTTGNKIIVEKYIYTEIIQPEEGVEDAKADTIVHPWDGKTYTISNWGNYNNRGNKYYKIFPTSWSNMFVDHNTDPDYMWEINAQGNGVYHISTAEVCSVWTNDSIARLFGVESYEGFLAFNAEDSRYLEDPTVMPLYPMLDPKFAEKINIEESESLLDLMQGVDAKIDWAFIPESEYAKYNDALAAYNYAETFLSNIEKIATEYPGVNTDAARSVYHNYNVSTLAEMKAAEADLEEQVHQIKLAYLEGASRENPVDASLLITNPTFDTIGDFNGWSGTAFGAGGTTSTCAEHYNKTFDTYQDIKGLPAGFYRFSVSGFYRRGSSANEWTLQTSENPDTLRNAIFYVVVGEDTTYVPVAAAGSGAVSTSFGGGTASVGTGLVIPNTMESGNYWFQNGYYDNYVTLLLDEEADVRIGVKKTVGIGSDWALFDNFAILYFGTIDGDPDYVLLQNQIDALDLQYPNEADVYANAEVKTNFFETLDEARDATENFTEYSEKLEAAATALAASVADYKLVKSAFDRCTSEQERFTGTAWEGLGNQYEDLKMLLDDGYNDGNAEEMLAEFTLGEETYSTTITGLSDFMDKMIIDYITENVSPGDEITLLINNPSFDSRFSGWTRVSGNNPAWGGNKNSQGTNKAVNYETNENYVDMELTGGCAEVFHATFDIQQVVKNLPKGSYTLTVQAFSRHDDNKFVGDWEADENHETGITAVLYCNDFEKKVQNILGSAQPWPIFGYGDNYSFDKETNAYTKDGWAGDNYVEGYGFIPNGMEGANYHFNIDKHNYENKIDFVLTEDGQDITIGIKNTATDSWVLFDNFRLYYNGNDKDVYTDQANEMIAKLATIADTDAGTDAKDKAAAAKEAIENALTDDAKTADDLLAAIADGNTAINYANESVELYSKLNDELTELSEVYEQYASQALPTTVDEAGVALDEIGDAVDNYNRTNEEVQALIDKANALETGLKIPDYSGASKDTPVDFSNAFIVNGTFDTVGDFTGWSGTAFGAGGNTSTNAEHYNKTYDSYQRLSGLPAGYYVATVQGYYRHGSAANDWTLYGAEDKSTQTQAYFYAQSDVDTVETQVKYISECAVEAGTPWISDGTSGVGDGLVVPNYMTTATSWFDQIAEEPESPYTPNKYYNNLLQVYVGEDGTLRLGVKKSATINDNDWSIYDNFKLYYIGSEPDPGFTTAIAEVEPVAPTFNVQGIYNLQGQKLGGLQKGLNIVNGKKVLVK